MSDPREYGFVEFGSEEICFNGEHGSVTKPSGESVEIPEGATFQVPFLRVSSERYGDLFLRPIQVEMLEEKT